MFRLRVSGLVLIERDDVGCGCGEILADRRIDWREAQPDPWVSFDGDVGETVLPQEFADLCPYVQAGIICELSFFWVVKLYCPYDAKDPFVTQIFSFVDSGLEFWEHPTEVGVDYLIDEGQEGFYLLQGDLFVTGCMPFSLLHVSLPRKP